MINNFDCVYDMQNSDAKGNKRKQRVLFVDDDADVLDGLRVALRKAPFDSLFVKGHD
jgi:PleD family two-component response regulator